MHPNWIIPYVHSPLLVHAQARRKKNEEDELDALFTQYALALSFFERWCKRGADVATITTTLASYGDRTQVSSLQCETV